MLLHVRTTKGKGYAPAEEAPDRFHGTSPFSVPTGECAPSDGAPPSYTEVFGKALVSLARRDERIVGITAAMAAGTGLDYLEQAFPHRFFDVGIAEGHAVGFAAGLAAAGLRPVVALYSTFVQRAYDQIIHDVCLPGLPVVLAIDRAGLVGEDGPTHHGAFDLSFLRLIPGLTILVPKDEAELQSLLATALSMDGPVAIRYPRGRGMGVPLSEHPVPLAEPWVENLITGGEVLLLATGTGVALALGAAAILEERGIAASVANVRKVSPLDEEELLPLFAEHEAVVTIEENTVAGGFGSSIAELMQRTGVVRPMVLVGLPDEFVTHGDIRSLHESIGFTVAGVEEAAVLALARSGVQSA